jgi:hypothetical protein
MAESSQKSLEMRVAELEDKLSKVHITEEEMKAYHKVAALTGGAHSAAKPSIIDYCLSCYYCYNCYFCQRCLTECTECIVATKPTVAGTEAFKKLGK